MQDYSLPGFGTQGDVSLRWWAPQMSFWGDCKFADYVCTEADLRYSSYQKLIVSVEEFSKCSESPSRSVATLSGEQLPLGAVLPMCYWDHPYFQLPLIKYLRRGVAWTQGYELSNRVALAWFILDPEDHWYRWMRGHFLGNTDVLQTKTFLEQGLNRLIQNSH